MLSEYKLDSRLKGLIPPRGVYISSDRLAVDLMQHDEPGKEMETLDNRGDKVMKPVSILTPSEFNEVQAQFVGSMRKSVEFNGTLEEAIKEVELASIASRMVSNGKCHYCEVPFFPIPCTVTMFKEVWYNMPIEDMFKELGVAVLKQFR
jgi:hypothetical protein